MLAIMASVLVPPASMQSTRGWRLPCSKVVMLIIVCVSSMVSQADEKKAWCGQKKTETLIEVLLFCSVLFFFGGI